MYRKYLSTQTGKGQNVGGKQTFKSDDTGRVAANTRVTFQHFGVSSLRQPDLVLRPTHKDVKYLQSFSLRDIRPRYPRVDVCDAAQPGAGAAADAELCSGQQIHWSQSSEGGLSPEKKTLEEPRKPPHFTVCQNRNNLAGAKQTDKQTNKRKEFYGEQTEQVNIYNV
ncbi:hypothetical protein F2P81_013346 [Scophthalmus maximus]|uniref:Uncharacterized protein n=1 Tax=Scophthalmus maximus TaxID=52904 RepID=A0A6A4SU00_SCOMX|nr:hypothetical protein F2P81_013346 [Scophthalmus maximus]